MDTLTIKSIGKLLAYTFNIPSYQRGYRWKAAYQVKDLLEDIWNYPIDHNNVKAFYCLQPIVVKPIENVSNTFELLDGQQRISSILLILHYFNEVEFKKPKKCYSIEFETRFEQQDFLKKIDNAEYCETNIDLFHLNQAYSFIKKWFDKKESVNPSINGEFYRKLINRVKVIWYVIEDKDGKDDAIDIFTRLNIGKIPLTNAELIKALFLSRSGANLDNEGRNLKQISIASEWDRIEQTLQKSDFWYFICKTPNKYDTRIEYIFDLIKNKGKDDETYYTFHQFAKDFEIEQDIEVIWNTIKRYFLTFEEWYQDRELFHLVGYLITIGKWVQDLIPNENNSHLKIPKSAYKIWLKEQALSTIDINALDSLSFGESKDKPKIRKVLLLFNIFSILENPNSTLRFPFDQFHTQKWDLEHIRPQTDMDVLNKNKMDWATMLIEYFTGISWIAEKEQAIRNEIKTLPNEEKIFCKKVLHIIQSKDDNETFLKQVYEELRAYFKENDNFEDMDGLSNLALLDQSTNRMYQNAFFSVKRKHIIEQEKLGVFIPLCTRNVFLKAYSKKLGEVMYWNNSDSYDYFSEILRVLNPESNEK